MFALADAMAEIKRLHPGGEAVDVLVELHVEQDSYLRVKGELGHHFGARFRKADRRIGEPGVVFSGMRIFPVQPGNSRG